MFINRKKHYIYACVCADALSRCSLWCDDSDTWLHVTLATEHIRSPTFVAVKLKLSFFTTGESSESEESEELQEFMFFTF